MIKSLFGDDENEVPSAKATSEMIPKETETPSQEPETPQTPDSAADNIHVTSPDDPGQKVETPEPLAPTEPILEIPAVSNSSDESPDIAPRPVAPEPKIAAEIPPSFEPKPFVPDSKAEVIRKSGLAYSAGIALFGSVVFMLILGWFADLLLGLTPWGTVTGIAIGAVIGFAQFFRITSQIINPKPNDFERVSLRSRADSQAPFEPPTESRDAEINNPATPAIELPSSSITENSETSQTHPVEEKIAKSEDESR